VAARAHARVQRTHAAGGAHSQAEACDQLGGFLLLQSMAGGTGAGLGTYLVEALRCGCIARVRCGACAS
jgi:hypothetical protein